MNRRFAIYRLFGQRAVEGWLESGAVAILKVLDDAQRSKKITGAVAEIGVHHGKLFIALALLQSEGERSLAIDVFGDQQLNIDNSGKGDLEQFRQNLERWSPAAEVVIQQGDSTKLSPDQVLALTGSYVRLFSVDGGHTEDIVVSDMTLAERVLAPGGIVIADDIFNERWPGVATGTFRYIQNGTLQPFAVGFNKVFFSSPDYTQYYREILDRYLENRYPLMAATSELAGYQVVLVGRVFPRPRKLLARSKTAKRLYHRIRTGQ